jgi:hypothetical protein
MAVVHRVPGPISVSVAKGSGGWLPLGVTKAGAIIRIENRWEPITCDAFGSEPADYVAAGGGCQIEIIGLDIRLIETALAAILEETWGAIQKVGYLVSGETNSAAADCIKVKMTEWSLVGEQAQVWEADKCIIANTHEIALRSTQEFQVPLIFNVLPDSDGLLFQTLPSYIRA